MVNDFGAPRLIDHAVDDFESVELVHLKGHFSPSRFAAAHHADPRP